MTAPIRVQPDPLVVKRQNDLFDLYNNWPGSDDPDDDPDFLAQARQIMGLAVDDATPLPQSDNVKRSRELALLGVTRALGHDTTPGHDQLHHYWTVGPGLAKWAESPEPWTTLVAELTKYVGPEKAKIYASRWVHDVFHEYTGSDAYRLEHGGKIRGHRVGPG